LTAVFEFLGLVLLWATRKNVAWPLSNKCNASTSQSNNVGVSHKRFKPSTPNYLYNATLY